MGCNSAILLAVAAFFSAVLPAAADVIPVTISEQVTASGGAAFCVVLLPPFGGCATEASDSFFSSDSNAAPGPYTANKSGNAIAQRPGFQPALSANASAQQTSNVSATNLSTSSQTFSEIGGLTNHVLGMSASAYSDYLVQFQLTSPSLLHLTGFHIGAFTNPDPGIISASLHSTADVLLTGPTFQFEVQFATALDELFTLDPGLYTFHATSSTNATFPGSIVTGSASAFSTLTVNADFAPIPEPRWMSLLCGLMLILCSRLRRAPARDSARPKN